MYPRWHILAGAILTLLVWLVFPSIRIGYLLLIFLSSFLIDFDHYCCAVIKTKKFSLFSAIEYHKIRNWIGKKKDVRTKGDFHLFHTVEFHLLIALLGLIWIPFFYIFIGMTFHSLLDVISLLYGGYIYRREYFFSNWLIKRL